MLRHQLAAPVGCDLTFVRGISEATVAGLLHGGEPSIGSFSDLFGHPSPPTALLELAKQYGKHLSEGEEGEIPSEIGTTLYYAAISKALLCGERISTLDEASLRRGLHWHLGRSWLVAPLRELMIGALARLDEST